MLLSWTLLMILLPVMLPVLSASPMKLQGSQAHNRTSRGQDCYEDEYEYKGICCKNCPAGTYVSAHCTMNHHRGKCEPCPLQDFTAFPNGMESCLPCLTCTKDKVLVESCTPKSDAKCECKSGSYCTPDEPCEVCNRCSRCREGQRVKTPCTSTSDTVCEVVSGPEPTSPKINMKGDQSVPAATRNMTGLKAGTTATNLFKDLTGIKTGPTEPPDDRTAVYIAVPIASTVLFALIVGIFLCKRKSKDTSETSLMDTTQNNSVSTLDVQSGGPDPKKEDVYLEREPLMMPKLIRVEYETQRKAEPYVRLAQREPVENNAAEPLGGDEETEEVPQAGEQCEECRQPQPCDKQWTEFFYIVIDSICPQRILELVRKLHLTKAAIDQIVKDYQNNCKEQSYKLLEEWRCQRGTQASMRGVLHVLHDMGLGGCCENIVNNLRTKRIPMN
ncbi:tumor necrosis factor receptor superfamily member 1A-like [Dendropsophus ebraccatus]|uniref:tumor necrosis factor receptor superfamily member 1A-like n=1 Tax=Dendropsophus ebraccatus TaxID=150705 RepID=UPI0038315FEB